MLAQSQEDGCLEMSIAAECVDAALHVLAAGANERLTYSFQNSVLSLSHSRRPFCTLLFGFTEAFRVYRRCVQNVLGEFVAQHQDGLAETGREIVRKYVLIEDFRAVWQI